MLYEENPDKGKIKFMGIVLKRRDNASIVKDIYGGIIDKIVKEKSIIKAMNFTRECLQNMVDEKYPIEKLIVTKSLRGFYKNPKQIAHNVLADRIGDREQGNRPLPGDRIEYAYIKNPDRRALQGEKIETPNFIRQNGIKIDYSFYITNQIMKPILQLFALAIEDMNELKKRYGNSLNKWYRMLEELCEKWIDDEEKFIKKCEELKCKEVKAILFEPYLNMLKE
jgi:DNA polymerase elongation subunit (family B)